MTAQVELKHDGNVAIITLNRPDKLNAMTDEMYNRLTELFTAFQADDKVRAVIVTGAGRAFCSGSDVTTMVNTNLVAGRARMQTRHQMINAIVNLEKPVIAAVRGATVGIGFSMAMACDLIIASDNAKFSQIFKKIGLIPDGGSIFFLVQRIGVARAKELVYTARMLLAEEAREWGIINRVVPDAELETNALALAQEMAGSATFALALAKKMFQSMYTPNLEAHLEQENLCQAVAKLTDDHLEGVAAFKEKRAAVFKGR
ncbi:MAG: enoyl-CoA hydratase-related protein [Burkholderiales bacterium]